MFRIGVQFTFVASVRFSGFQIVIKCLRLLFIDVKPHGMGSVIVLIDLSCVPDFAREVPEETILFQVKTNNRLISYYRVILLSLQWAVT